MKKKIYRTRGSDAKGCSLAIIDEFLHLIAAGVSYMEQLSDRYFNVSVTDVTS